MPKFADQSVYDAALNVIKTAVTQTVCTSQPANYAGINAAKIASTPMTSGDFTLAAGSGSPSGGRKVTMAAKNSVAVATPGTATHIVLDNGTTLIYVTTCTSVVIPAGTVNIPAWTVEIVGPT